LLARIASTNHKSMIYSYL